MGYRLRGGNQCCEPPPCDPCGAIPEVKVTVGEPALPPAPGEPPIMVPANIPSDGVPFLWIYLAGSGWTAWPPAEPEG